MITNLWPFERAVRVSGGMFLFASPSLNLHTYPWNLLGLVLAITGFVGFCPLYASASGLRRLFSGSTPRAERSQRLPPAGLRSAEQ